MLNSVLQNNAYEFNSGTSDSVSEAKWLQRLDTEDKSNEWVEHRGAKNGMQERYLYHWLAQCQTEKLVNRRKMKGTAPRASLQPQGVSAAAASKQFSS